MTETPNLKIPHGGYVVVGDGRRVLVLRNEGHALHLALRVQHVFEAPPTRRRASRARTGRPASGRGSTAAPSNRRIGTRSPRSASRTRSRLRWTASPTRSPP
jgi:protein required for attachment to host cells